MAKRKAKKARRNPSRRRRNPDGVASVVDRAMETPTETINLLKSDGITLGAAAVAGVLALSIVKAKVAPRLTMLSGAGLGIAVALAGAAAGVFAGNVLGNDDLGKAIAGAALTLGVAQMAEPIVASFALGEWQSEHLSGYSPYGQQYISEDEATLSGLGQPVHPPLGLDGTMGSYEPLGDIFNSQRLGSFEAEHGVAGLSGFGEFVPEVARADRDQQPAETKSWNKNQSLPGFYAGYEMGEHMYDDLFGPNS